MGKIDDFEQQLITQGMTDGDLAEYGKLLKRVRGNYARRQHCYTTAIQFPRHRADQAIRLIQYGLEQFDDGWFTTYTSHLYIGRIYENSGRYPEAFGAYLSAKQALGPGQGKYAAELSKDLLWMKLHADAFRYSAELEEYLACYETSGDFSKAFVNASFKAAIAKLVISMHYGKTGEARQFLETARSICEPGHTGALQPILARHRYSETWNPTPESLAFIRELNI